MRGFKYKKAVQALNYFASKNGGRINKMKALKLIWLSDRYHLRKYGRTITDDVYFALPFGPVASTTRDLVENNSFLSDTELEYRDNFIHPVSKIRFDSLKKVDKKVFSKTDIEVLKTIFNEYKDYSQFELSELSHEFPEWKRYESFLNNITSSRYRIKIEDFFSNVEDGHSLFVDDNEYIDLSKKLFLHKIDA